MPNQFSGCNTISIIALTGAFGAGKSSARTCFGTLGYHVGDADGYCHDLYASPTPELREALAARWGKSVFAADGALDRKVVGSIVFDNSEELNFLTSLVHPLVRTRVEREIASARSNRKRLLIEVPLLFEHHFETYFDATVAIWAPETLRRQRLRGKNFTDRQIDRRDALQLSADIKLERADYGLINHADKSLLMKQCTRLDETFRARQS